MATINVPVFVDGTLSADNMQCGTVTVTPPSGGGSASADVTGLSLAGTGNLFVQVTSMTMVPSETVRNATVSARTGTGFTVNINRTNGTQTAVFWIATRNP